MVREITVVLSGIRWHDAEQCAKIASQHLMLHTFYKVVNDKIHKYTLYYIERE